jgi:hypothetical protein
MGGRFRKAITNPYQIKRAAVLCSIRVGTAACLRGKLGKTVFTNEGAVEFGERALDGERSANRAFGIVLLRDRMSKQRHQPVAELLGHAPAHLRHRP